MLLRINGFAITAGFGSIDSAHKTPHNGIDFAMPMNTPVPSMSEGVVQQLTTNDGYGNAIHVRLFNGDEVVYGHLSEFKCKVGEVLHRGDIIGLSGSTGKSTGPHLHVSVLHYGKEVDPAAYFHQLYQGSGTTGFAWLDSWSEIWKENAQFIFNMPKWATDAPATPTEMAKTWIEMQGEKLIALLNFNSAEIITFAILICAAGMMVAPLYGGRSGVWGGRALGAFFGGVVWRAVIA